MEEKLSRQKRKRNITHSNIMHAAKALFEIKGIGNVTVEEIAEKADISRSTFFNHFSTIDELLNELAHQEIIDLLEVINKQDKEGISNIKALMEKLVEDTYYYPSLTISLLTSGILSPQTSSAFQDVLKLITNELKKSKINNSVFSYEEYTAIILGTFFGLVYQKFITNSEFDDKEKLINTISKLLFKIKPKED